MPHTDCKPTYQVLFTSEEYRLVCLGLAGKLRDKKDLVRALELNVQMLHQRTIHLKTQAEISEKALENAQKDLDGLGEGKEEDGNT